MDVTIDFAKLIVPLSAVLGLSLVVERVLELLKNSIDSFIGTKNVRARPDLAQTGRKIAELEYRSELYKDAEAHCATSEALAKRLLDLEKAAENESDARTRDALVGRAKDLKALGEWDESCPQSKVLVLPATIPDDGSTIRAFVLQLFGFATGILLARFSGLGLFGVFLGGGIRWWDFVLTGLLIGGGSAPIHILIRFITERKIPAQATESEEASQAVPEPGAPIAAGTTSSPLTSGPVTAVTSPIWAGDEWVDIPYDGGVDKELLEKVQIRKVKLDTVIYHHTAMKLSSSFEDVVQVIKNRTDSRGQKWLTGYNCVVVADGSVHAFCRWDRYGSHALEYNPRSLGLAFNGNFETDSKVPYSNPNGAYGSPRPTQVQLESGARVVALWTFLYPDIRPDFATSIIPHSKVSPKTCPGNMFPYDDFKKLIEHYRKLWECSSLAQARIAAYKLKPYIYP